MRDTERFGVNVLAAGEDALARRFASKLPEAEKFAGVAHAVQDGIPVLEDALAWVGCRLDRLIPGGDHTIGIGAVEAAETGARARPADLVPRRATAAWRDRRPHRARRRARGRQPRRRGCTARGPGGSWHPAPGFWPLLRAGQLLVVVEAAHRRACSRSSGEELPPLHLVYGLTPLGVAFVAEQLRLIAAQTELDHRKLEGRDAVAALPAEAQRELVRAIVRREIGVMAASALVVALLGVRASGWL